MKTNAILLVLVLGATAWAVDEKDLGPGVSVTVYNNNLAVVKERREMELAPGTSWVKFADVAALIDATSVAFSSLTDASGTKVLEQNYEFDLVSASKLLDKYVDKPVTVVTQDGEMVSGSVLSSDGAQVVLRLKDGSVTMVPRDRNIKDIIFGKLPEGLLTKPTLVWRVSAAKGGKQLIRVAYMTTGMDWRADYTLVLSEKEDAINWAGWVTVNNRTGTRFENAEIKLMAGDVHRVEARREVEDAVHFAPRSAKAGSMAKAVEEKAFAEYHLYTVTAPSTLNDQQTKQLEFVTRDGVKVQKKYFYRPQRGGWWWVRPTSDIDVEIRFKNEKAIGMGIPLPAGVVRLYKRDWEGELHLLGASSIEHTPKDEELKFAMGNAFDIVGERVVTGARRPSERSYEEDVAITLRNHKAEAVTIEVEETMGRSPAWSLTQQSINGTRKDVSTMVWPVAVGANSESKLTYTVQYTW